MNINNIVRQTMVFADGSMCIMVRQPNGTMSVEWRNKNGFTKEMSR